MKKGTEAADMNGTVVVDKPSGKTSFDIVHDIRKVLNIKKIGHTGTLDPMTTGVLPVCINEATKLIRFFVKDDKEYRATMLLGVETDTLDMEGRVLAQRESDVTADEVGEAIESFVGTIDQRVPRYSAVKYRGKPLYKWTREGVDITPPLRTVEIYRITVEEISLPYVTFVVTCSKGTYIRSLCADIGTQLGCGACLYTLRRIKSGHFREESAIVLEGLDKKEKERVIRENLLPMADTLPHFSSITIGDDAAEKIKRGHQPDAEVLTRYSTETLAAGDVVKFVSEDNRIVALARILVSSAHMSRSSEDEEVAKILRVFNG